MFGFFVQYGRKVASYQRQKAAVRDLSALDDRMLKDLGISRGQITSVAAGFDSRQR